MDYDDAILKALELIAEEPIARQYCDSFRFTMVDEYQDTNTAQAALVREVVRGNNNLMVVADDDQAIYRFRGASTANIQKFREDFPTATEILLVENRRSTPEIITFSKATIKKATDREEKEVQAVKPNGTKIEIIRTSNQFDEANFIGGKIATLLEDGVDPLEIAILVRQNSHIDLLAKALRDLGIPYINRGGSVFFHAPEIKDALALFEAINDPTHSIALLKCLSMPHWKMTPRSRQLLLQEINRGERPLIDILQNPHELPWISEANRTNIVQELNHMKVSLVNWVGISPSQIDKPVHELIASELNSSGLSEETLRSSHGFDWLCEADQIVRKVVVARLMELSEKAYVEPASEIFWEAIQETGYFGVVEKLNDLDRQQLGANLWRMKTLMEEVDDEEHD